MDEKQEFEMGLPNGVGDQMLAHTIEKFDEELEKAKVFLYEAIEARLNQLEGKK